MDNIFILRFETKYGPDSFVSRLTPLKSTTYDGLESYNPNKYIGKSDIPLLYYFLLMQILKRQYFIVSLACMR